MPKIVRDYQVQFSVEYEPWTVSLPLGAEVIGFVQIGSVGKMLVLEDAAPEAVRYPREFLTAFIGREFTGPAGKDMKFLGCLILNDPITRIGVGMTIPLVVFELTSIKEPSWTGMVH